MKLILIFLLKNKTVLKNNTNITHIHITPININTMYLSGVYTDYKKIFSMGIKNFLIYRFNNTTLFFINKFILCFLEIFFKNKIIFNLKKGSNKLVLKQISSFFFNNKFFKKNLKVKKQIIGVLYYSILLKDASIFSNFFKKSFEQINIKLHKKLLLGLKKIIKELFWPIFNTFGLLGIFLNIKGKLGVSGNAKKRRYYFYFGQHSITKKTLKISHTQDYIWTYTGSLGFGFYLFF